jgi:aminomethyltransferase
MSATWAKRSSKGHDYASTARALETLIPIDILGLRENRQRYGMLTNQAGGTHR